MRFLHTTSLRRFLPAALVLFFASAMLTTLWAAPNQQINYQGKLTDSTGATVANGEYGMEFKLYTAPTGGSAIWTENSTSTVTNGLFSVMLGSSTSLTNVNFNQTLYLGVNIQGDGEMTPRKIIGTVPAAFEARKLGGVASSSFLRSDQADTASSLLTFTGGLLSNSSSTITDLTSITATTTNLVINGERFTDLTGTGLENFSNTLRVATTTLGLGDGTFLGLSDTPGSFTANRLPFTNSAGNALTDSAELTFDGGRLFVVPNGGQSDGIVAANAFVGHHSAGSTDAVFSHKNAQNNTDHALRHSSAGKTTLNAADGSFGGIFFSINGTNQAALDVDGNFGIGTTTPASKLDVWGDLRVGTSSLSTLFADVSTGNVGIGTTTPAYDLTVDGDTWLNGALYDSVNNSAGVNGYVLQTTGSGTEWVATSTLGLGGGGSADGNVAGPTLIVAASDSLDTTRADYVADGTADQTEINQAINALPASGGVVQLLEGTYNLSGSINATTSSTTLRGSGMATKLFLTNTSNADVIRVQGENITIESMYIDGNKAGNGGGAGIAYPAATGHMKNLRIENVYIKNAAEDGIALEDSTGGPTAIIRNNVIEGSGSNGVRDNTAGSPLGFIQISNNDIKGNTQLGIHMDNRGVIAGNSVSNNAGLAGIYIASGANEVVVSDNHVYDNVDGLYLANSSHITVTGNQFSDNTDNGAYVYGSWNTFTGNVFRSNGAYGMELHANVVGNSTISSNQFYTNGDSAIYAPGTYETSITGNQFDNNAGSGASSTINITGFAWRLLVEGNSITDDTGTGYGIEIGSDAEDITIADNDLYGAGAENISDSGINTRYDQSDRNTLTTKSNVGHNLLKIYGSSTLALASTTQLGTGAIEEWGNSSGNVMTLDNSGNLLLGTSTSRGLLTVDGDLFVGTSSLSTLFVDVSTGNVGIGTNNPERILDIVGERAVAQISRYTSTPSEAGFLFRKARGTQDTPLIVEDGDGLGTLQNYGWDGDSFVVSSVIRGKVDGAVSTGTVPGLLVFETADTAGTLSERMWLDSSGDLSIGSSTSRARLTVDGDLFVGTSSAPALYADVSTGRVGMGTSTPNSQLTIAQNADNNGLRIYGYDDVSMDYGNIMVDGNGIFLVNAESGLGALTGVGNVAVSFWTDDTFFMADDKELSFGTDLDYAAGYHSASDSFRFVDGNDVSSDANARLTILSSGNVGIGTTTPARDLTVAGDTWLNGALYDSVNNSAGTNGYVLQTTGSGFAWVATSTLGISGGGGSSLFTDGGATTYLTSLSDSLAVGTDTASSKFTVAQSADSSGISVAGFDDQSSSVGQMYINSSGIFTIDATGSVGFGYLASGGTPVAAWNANLFVMADNKELAFGDGNDYSWGYHSASDSIRLVDGSNVATDANARLTVLNSGNVGIGTTTPGYRLSVAGDFFVGTSSLGTLFADVSTGRVGIGTTTPQNRLSVLETIDSPQVRVSYDGSRFATFKVDSAGDLIVAASGGSTFFNDDNVFICTGGSCPGGDPTGTGNLFVENKLGLGTTTPEAPLDIWSGAGAKIAQFFATGVDMLVGILTFDSTPASDHSASGNTVKDIAASTTIAIGNSVYLNSAGAWGLADATSSSTVSHFMGVAIEAGSNGEDIAVATDGAYVRDDSWSWTTGGTVYASTSPGVMTQTAPSGSGNVVRIIGTATSQNVIKLEYGSIIVLN